MRLDHHCPVCYFCSCCCGAVLTCCCCCCVDSPELSLLPATEESSSQRSSSFRRLLLAVSEQSIDEESSPPDSSPSPFSRDDDSVRGDVFLVDMANFIVHWSMRLLIVTIAAWLGGSDEKRRNWRFSKTRFESFIDDRGRGRGREGGQKKIGRARAQEWALRQALSCAHALN